MRKVYELEDLCCANCAAKMERALNELDLVEKATVTFMTSRLTLTVPDGSDMKQILKVVQKVIEKYEPDCRVVVK